MSDSHHCDWCLRPLAPEGVSWDDVDDPEGYCWGDEQQGCACDDAHEEAWPKMLSEVARLREQVAEEQPSRWREAILTRAVSDPYAYGLYSMMKYGGSWLQALEETVLLLMQDRDKLVKLLTGTGPEKPIWQARKAVEVEG